MRRLNRFTVICLFIALVSLISLASSTVTSSPAIPSTPPKALLIGIIQPLSGPLSMIGVGMADAARMAADWINGKGGVTVGNEKYLINLDIQDDKATPTDTIAAVNKLVFADHVNYIFGTLTPYLNSSIDGITLKNKVIHATSGFNGGSKELTADSVYTFMTRPIRPINELYDFMSQNYPGAKNIAISYQEDAASTFVCQQTKIAAEAHGLKVVYMESHPVDVVDFYPILTKLLATKPDIIDLGGASPTLILAKFKQARELGFQGPMVISGAGALTLIQRNVNKDLATDFITMDLDPAGSSNVPPIMQEIKQFIQSKYNKVITVDHLFAWNGLWCIAQAIQAAGTVDTTKVAETWSNMKTIETAYGTGTMRGAKTFGINHVLCYPNPVTRLTTGKAEIVKWLPPAALP